MPRQTQTGADIRRALARKPETKPTPEPAPLPEPTEKPQDAAESKEN